MKQQEAEAAWRPVSFHVAEPRGSLLDASGHVHGPDCDHSHDHDVDRSGLLGALAPVVACLFCPACMSLWVPMVASSGFAVAATESQHGILLAISVTIAMASAVWRLVRRSDRGAFALTALGCALLVSAHVVEVPMLEVAGMLVLIGLAVTEVWRSVRPAL